MTQWRKYLLGGTSFLILAIAWGMGYANWLLPPGWQIPVLVISGLMLIGWGFVFWGRWLAAGIEWPTRHASEMPPEDAPQPDPPQAEPARPYPFPINRLPLAVQDLAFVLLVTLALVLVVQAYGLYRSAMESLPRSFDHYILLPITLTGVGYLLAKLEIRWRLWRLGYVPPKDF